MPTRARFAHSTFFPPNPAARSWEILRFVRRGCGMHEDEQNWVYCAVWGRERAQDTERGQNRAQGEPARGAAAQPGGKGRWEGGQAAGREGGTQVMPWPVGMHGQHWGDSRDGGGAPGWVGRGPCWPLGTLHGTPKRFSSSCCGRSPSPQCHHPAWDTPSCFCGATGGGPGSPKPPQAGNPHPRVALPRSSARPRRWHCPLG